MQTYRTNKRKSKRRYVFVWQQSIYIKTINFSKIPGSPIAYWVSDNFIKAFETGNLLGDYAIIRNGMKTGKNEEFIRLWWEISKSKLKTNAENFNDAINSNLKWFPYNKGGEYRKWYGNNDYVVNWMNAGFDIFTNPKAENRHVQDYPNNLKFTPSLSWSLITSGKPAFRFKQNNISDIAGMSLYTNYENVIRFLALLNTKVSYEILVLIAPTINFQAGDIARIPYLNCKDDEISILKFSKENIRLSEYDWDTYETSWDFKKSPLV